MRRLLSSSKLCMTSSPAVRPHRAVRRQHLRATCFKIDTCVCFTVINRYTGSGSAKYHFFCLASMYFSMWLGFINKSHDFLAQMQRNSSEAYRSHCKNNMTERSKSFQNFASVLLSKAIAKTIWPSVQKAFKILPAFAFKSFPAICFQKAFKRFPAIYFQKFSSDLLSKNFLAICFQNFACSLAFKSFQKFSRDLLSKSFQNFPAISFQKFSSDLLSKFWTLRDSENFKAHCFQNFINEFSFSSFWKQLC